MTHYRDYEELLNDYLDGRLAPPRRAEMERHLPECAPCRQALSELRSLQERAASLPRSLEPPHDLWLGIRSSLPPHRGGASPFFPDLSASAAMGRGNGYAWVGAFALALLAIALIVALRQEGTPGIPPRAATAPASAAVGALGTGTSLRLMEAEYREPTAQLQAALRRGGRGASPEAVQVLEENLRIVNGAIREVHRAVQADAGRGVEDQFVARLYRTRFELLRQAVRLSSREGEEKKS